MMHLALLTLLVAQTPSITITAPVASSDVVAKTTFNITWDVVAVSDVKIEVTTDGSSWSTITDTVDTVKPGWRNFPWSVPDVVSSACRIRISDYLSGTPSVESETFSIHRAAEDDEGGCAAAPGGPLAAFLLLLRRRRR